MFVVFSCSWCDITHHIKYAQRSFQQSCYSCVYWWTNSVYLSDALQITLFDVCRRFFRISWRRRLHWVSSFLNLYLGNKWHWHWDSLVLHLYALWHIPRSEGMAALRIVFLRSYPMSTFLSASSCFSAVFIVTIYIHNVYGLPLFFFPKM